MHKFSYRPEIDGLRAIAVLLVLFFHLGSDLFQGGYIGVDVFLVISGYLITGILYGEIKETGSLSFLRFYSRRIRRLFPSLFATSLICTISAFFIYLPNQFERFGRSLMYSSFSLSNFYFWKQSNYFDTDAVLKPLLHTWSLAIEEQFYLIWPLALLLIAKHLKGKTLLTVILSVGTLSLILNFTFMSENTYIQNTITFLLGSRAGGNPATIFYLLPFRIFEFIIGGCIVFLPSSRLSTSKTSQCFLTALGLVMILFSAIWFDEKLVFPSYFALLPCLGTFLVIRHSEKKGILNSFLTLKPLVYIGLISYSLYLIHWPVITFYYYYSFGPLNIIEMSVIFISSVLLAHLMYKYVETPFRKSRSNSSSAFQMKKTIVLGILSMCLLASLGYIIQENDGFPNRMNSDVILKSKSDYRDEESSYCLQRKHSFKHITCGFERNSKDSIYVWGDSHARHLMPGLATRFPNHNIYIIYLSDCLPQNGIEGFTHPFIKDLGVLSKCSQRNQETLEYFKNLPPTQVLLHYYVYDGLSKTDRYLDSSRKLLETLKESGHNTKLLGGNIRPNKPMSECVALPFRSFVANKELAKNRCKYRLSDSGFILKENDFLKENLSDKDFINPNDILCNTEICDGLKDEKLLFRDKHHFTVEGSIQFIEKIKPEIQ